MGREREGLKRASRGAYRSVLLSTEYEAQTQAGRLLKRRKAEGGIRKERGSSSFARSDETQAGRLCYFGRCSRPHRVDVRRA